MWYRASARAFLGIVMIFGVMTALAKKDENPKIDVEDATKIMIYPFQCRDMKAADQLAKALIESISEKSKIPVVPYTELEKILEQKNLKKGVADPVVAGPIATETGSSVFILGKIIGFTVKESESDIPGQSSKRGNELTCDMKFEVEISVYSTDAMQLLGTLTYEESHRDTRTNPYKLTMEESKRDELPAATIILLERAGKSLSKKMIKNLSLAK